MQQTQWDLITRVYNQDFVRDIKLENPAVLYKPKPHDLMFKRMMENPYQFMRAPKGFVHDLKKNNEEEKDKEKEKETEKGTEKEKEPEKEKFQVIVTDVDGSAESNHKRDFIFETEPLKEDENKNKSKEEKVVIEINHVEYNEKEGEDSENGEKSEKKEILRKRMDSPNSSLVCTTKQNELQPFTSSSEVGALAPPRTLHYLDLLCPTFNPGAVDQDTLDLLDTLEFDIFPFKDRDDEDFTILLLMHLFYRLDLVDYFKIPEETLFRFLKTICFRYRYVPFHNFYHAFNVTQTMFFFLRVVTVSANPVLGPLEKMALMIASLCHDCDHPGLNAGFQAKASTRISSLHKKSTLENHHLLHCMHILAQPECNILANLDDQSKLNIEIYIRHLILATDLALHGVIHRKLQDRRKTLGRLLSKAPQEAKDTKGSLELSLVDEDDRVLLMCCLLKCSDLSNEIRPTHIAQRWANLVMAEFFSQSDKERDLDLPVTPFMDKHKVIISKEQINFIEKLCLPLYEPLCGLFPGMALCTKQMMTNRNEWNKRLFNFFSDDEKEIKKLSNVSIWEREEVKGKKWDKLNVRSLLSSRSSERQLKKT